MGRTIYQGDQLIGLAMTAQFARWVVGALNGQRKGPGDRWTSVGRLVYSHTPTDTTPMVIASDWAVAMGTTTLARRVADALNGAG